MDISYETTYRIANIYDFFAQLRNILRGSYAMIADIIRKSPKHYKVKLSNDIYFSLFYREERAAIIIYNKKICIFRSINECNLSMCFDILSEKIKNSIYFDNYD